ncbi:MAG: hypothetical protein ACFCUQ_11985 [Kiloniellales bacterium]
MAPDTAVVSDRDAQMERGADCALLRQLFAGLPSHIRNSFTAEQNAALAEAARRCKWGTHQTDIRLSLPLFGKRYYLVLLAGEERRSKARRIAERSQHPFTKTGNLLFVGATVTVATVLGSLLWTMGFIWYLSN